MEQHAHTEEHPHEATGHGHSHGGDGHDHDHGGGLVGWFRGALPHSHRIEDKTDDELEGSERGVWALKLSLIGLGITAILQLSVVLISGSVALLADTIHNFGDAATSIPLWIAFALARRGASKRLTYGYGKTEDVAGGVIVLIIFLSACVAAYESVQKLIHPNTITHIGWVAVAAVVGFLGNEIVGVFRIRVGKEIGSAALVADGYHSRVDGFTSLAVLVGVAGVWAGVPILDPLIGIGITIAILFIVKDASLAVLRRMIDGIEPETVDAITDTASHVHGVEGVSRVRARWIGHKIAGEVQIVVAPDTSVAQAHAIGREVEHQIGHAVPRVRDVVVVAVPGGVPPTEGHGHAH